MLTHCIYVIQSTVKPQTGLPDHEIQLLDVCLCLNTWLMVVTLTTFYSVNKILYTEHVFFFNS